MVQKTLKTDRGDTQIQTLLEAAILAPSGDNTQPWRFEFDKTDHRIVVSVDPIRDTSPMNAGQRMSRIAVGAAVENILRTAKFNNTEATINSVTSNSVTIQMTEPVTTAVEIDEAIQARCTNRKPYDCGPLAPELLETLSRSPREFDDVSTYWTTERHRIAQIASIVRDADGILFSNASMRRAFLDNVRFDAADEDRVAEGLSLASLEVTGRARAAFRLLPKLPDWMGNLLRVGPSMARQSEKLLKSSSGVCLGVASNESPESDFSVGRAMQHAWLALTEQGLAAQPMMSLPVLANALHTGDEALNSRLNHNSINRLVGELREVFKANDAGHVAFMMRFGSADAPSGRTGRFPTG